MTMNKTLNELLDNEEISKRLWNVIVRAFFDICWWLENEGDDTAYRIFSSYIKFYKEKYNNINRASDLSNLITLEDITECFAKDNIYEFRGFGKKTVQEIVDLLDKYEIKHNLESRGKR